MGIQVDTRGSVGLIMLEPSAAHEAETDFDKLVIVHG